MNIILLILGIISFAYSVILISLCPGTFLDNLFSFKNIWAALGLYLIFLAIYRIKTKHSFWSVWKKWIKITFVSLAGFATIIAAINLIFILTPDTTTVDEKADYVILLGGGIDKNGVLPKTVMFRVKSAAEYLNANPSAICVVTGGTLNWLPYAEAPEIKNQLVNLGIDKDRILVEDQALDTIQNLRYSSKILAEYKNLSVNEILNSEVIIVTSRFHLRRSERLARRMGFKNIKGLPAACPAIYLPHNYVREICAYVKLNLRILMTGEPKSLEE